MNDTGEEQRIGTHHIRAWRKHRGLTVQQIAERAVIAGKKLKEGQTEYLTSSMITQLEKGRSGYSQRSLEAIARVLTVEPWQLLFSEPMDGKDDWTVLRAAMVCTPIYNEVEEHQQPVVETLFRVALSTAVEAARQMFGKHRHAEEEAA